jgi:hypothetical protein
MKKFDERQIKKWMRTPNSRFGGATPAAVIRRGGRARVEYELEQLKLGSDEIVRKVLEPYLRNAKGISLQFVRRQVARSRGARCRELAARYLLLHQDQLGEASRKDLNALAEYVREQRWKSLYGHDRPMYKLLRAGAEKFLGQEIRQFATVSKKVQEASGSVETSG